MYSIVCVLGYFVTGEDCVEKSQHIEKNVY